MSAKTNISFQGVNRIVRLAEELEWLSILYLCAFEALMSEVVDVIDHGWGD